jgi:peptidoglycan/LPS O-acetylase OafA/YrhL
VTDAHPARTTADQLGQVELPPREKIRALTSLRFFAALWVMLFHTVPRTDALAPVAARLVDLGYTAVTLFFVLSGFILAKVYKGLRGRPGIVRFLVARLARVYPMYLLSLLIDLPRLLIFRIAKFGLATAILTTGATFVFQAGLLQAWITTLGALNFPGWSISTEAFFYLAFPLALPVVERIQRPRDRLALAALLFAVTLGLAFGLGHDVGWRGDADFWRNPLLRLPEFLIGMLLAPSTVVGTPIGSGRRGAAMTALAIAAAVGFAIVLVSAPSIGRGRLIEVLMTPIFGATIVLMATTEHGLLKLVSGKTLVLLGEASYALYLLHAPVAALFGMAGVAFSQWFSLGYVAYLAVTVTASIVAHLLFEHPARRWIMTRWDAMASRAARAATSRVASSPKGA